MNLAREQAIVGLYARMAQFSAQMREAAQRDEWKLVAALECEIAVVVDELKQLGDLAPKDPECRRSKTAAIMQVLSDDAAIRKLTQPWLDKLDAMLATNTNQGRLNRSYGALATAR